MICFFNKFQNAVLLIFFAGLVSGCVSTTTEGDLPSTYHFSPYTKMGIAALTVSCNINNGLMPMSLYFHQESAAKNIKSDSFLQDYRIMFNCNSSNDSLSEPELKLISLPAGVYYFNYFNQYNVTYTISSFFNPLYFKVDPAKVNYLGWLQLVAGSNSQYTFVLKDGAQRDIPWIKQKLPFLKTNAIEIKPLFNKPTIK